MTDTTQERLSAACGRVIPTPGKWRALGQPAVSAGQGA